MTAIPSVGSANSTDLMSQLIRKVDTNNDGNISTAEFASFLTDLIAVMASSSSTKGLSSTAATSATSGTSSSASTLDLENSPLPACPGGWDAAKWVNPNHNTPKYVVGRILWRLPPTPESLVQALPSIQAQYPGTTLVGQDKLQIPGVGLIDVGVDFGPGHGMSWAWQDVTPS